MQTQKWERVIRRPKKKLKGSNLVRLFGKMRLERLSPYLYEKKVMSNRIRCGGCVHALPYLFPRVFFLGQPVGVA